ncbi:MAG TPA: FUSC family protein [Thermoleophilaceae bacterium]|nr:FUSC family protein [Thermoleophilaceae bacterium]
MTGDLVSASFARLRMSWWPVVQAAVAAGLAWYVTHDLLGHAQPFFAPIAAAISLGAFVGRRWRNAVQMMLGVTLGIVLAEAVVTVAGVGVVPLAVSVLIAMCAGVLLSPVPMFVNQSAASAILVVALRTGGIAGERLIDALIGGGCALLISLVLFPPHPLPLLGNSIRAALRQVASALAGAADALKSGRPRDADATLAITQSVHERVVALTQARVTARDIARLAPLRRRYRPDVERADLRAAHVGLLANTSLTLVRLAAAVLDSGEEPPAYLADELTRLSESTATLARGASSVERERVRETVTAIADERPPSYGPPEIAATELQLRAAAGDLLRVMRDQDEDLAWRHSLRVRNAVRASRPAEAARTARQAAARSGAGAFRRR